MPPSLDVVLVNRDSGRLLSECIESISRTRRESVALNQVVVVDDASTDDSMEGVGSPGAPLLVIRNSRHRGFAASCNVGAAAGASDYILFLNTDVRLSQDSLDIPVGYLEVAERDRVGIVGIRLVDEEGQDQAVSSRFLTPGTYLARALGLYRLLPDRFRDPLRSEWPEGEDLEVDQVIGAFMMIRRDVFDRLNGFDERFFVYGEDLDLALRASQLGFRSIVLGSTTAYHKGHGTSERRRAESMFFNMRSRIQYAFKHFGRVTALTLAAVVLVVEPLTRLAQAGLQGSTAEMKTTLCAYRDLWGWALSGATHFMRPRARETR